MKRNAQLKILVAAAVGGLALWLLFPRASLGKGALATAISALAAQGPGAPPIQHDLVYGQADGVDLKLDFVRPAEGAGPFPLVVCIHGGSWQSGSKSGYAMALALLAKNGYAAASLDYRLAPRYRFPAQIQDVRRALAFLREHAAEWNLDPDRIAVIGDSAGGHLALLLGLAEPGTGIRAIVNIYGPSDLARWHATPEGEVHLGMTSARLLELVFGTSDPASETLREASPIHQIGKARPAVLTFHGDADPVVKPEQAVWLHQALHGAGFDEKLVILKGSSHGLQGSDLTSAISEVIEFLAAHVKAPPERVHASR